MEGFQRAAKDRLFQKRMGAYEERQVPRMKLYKAPTMDREMMKKAGFATELPDEESAPEASGLAQLGKNFNKSFKNLVHDLNLTYDNTAFGRVEQAVALSVKSPDDAGLAANMCQMVGDSIRDKEIDVRCAVRIEWGVYVAIVDAVAARYCDHARDSEVQRLGVYAIYQLASSDKTTKEHLISLGVVDVIKASKEEGVVTAGEQFDEVALKALAA